MRRDTVGGRNPANQLIDMENIQLYNLKGFIHSRWLFGISEPSTLCCCTFLPGVYVFYAWNPKQAVFKMDVW